ncbi:MAG: helix-turn-helix transcriptional regulator [Chloroflexi bacterium]|nr:helix-turn-helix transcriptional regulator [Chloroflexota bacterium]
MENDVDLSIANSEMIISSLGKRIEKIRLSRNWTWEKLAGEAGVTWRTIANLEMGKKVSLDTFVRVLIALGIQGNFELLLPDPSIRPMERINIKSTERKRARQKKTEVIKEWTWNNKEGSK